MSVHNYSDGNYWTSAGYAGLAVLDAVAARAGIRGIGGAFAANRTSLAGSIPKVNVFPGAGTRQNCVNCVIATEKSLAGQLASALPSMSARPVKVITDSLGGRFIKGLSPSDIVHTLESLGPGARGIVYGLRNGSAGHVFNAVTNSRGAVKLIDGQIGKPGSFFGDYSGFWFLVTNAP